MERDEKLLVVIEVPKGCQNKYEYDARLGRMVLNRVLYSPMYYPGEYGFVPDTLAEDGDPLDVLVLSSISTFPGCAVPARVLGALDMYDDKGPDTKILAVVAVDPRLEEIDRFSAVPHHFLREVEHFFRTYKELEGKQCDIRGWQSEETAWELITQARQRFREEATRFGTPVAVPVPAVVNPPGMMPDQRADGHWPR